VIQALSWDDNSTFLEGIAFFAAAIITEEI
jgi:hypothetical protein